MNVVTVEIVLTPPEKGFPQGRPTVILLPGASKEERRLMDRWRRAVWALNGYTAPGEYPDAGTESLA